MPAITSSAACAIRPGLGVVELAEVLVGRGRGLFDDAERADDGSGMRIGRRCRSGAATVRLGPPVPVGGTSTSPMLSLSMRVLVTVASLRRERAATPSSAGPSAAARTIWMAASLLGHAQLVQIADTWLRTVVGEMNRRSEISAVRPVRISSSTSHSRPVRRAVGRWGTATRRCSRSLNSSTRRATKVPGRVASPFSTSLERVADARLVDPLQQIPGRPRPQRVEQILVLPRPRQHDDGRLGECRRDP